MTITDILGGIFLLAGAFFVVIGSLGLLRFPDFFTRTHATGKCDTLGLTLVLIGLAFFAGGIIDTIKLLLIAILIAVANPTATHAIARAAYRLGLKPIVSDSNNEKDLN